MALNSVEKITEFLENVSALSPWIWILEMKAAWGARFSYCVTLIAYLYSTKAFCCWFAIVTYAVTHDDMELSIYIPQAASSSW